MKNRFNIFYILTKFNLYFTSHTFALYILARLNRVILLLIQLVRFLIYKITWVKNNFKFLFLFLT